MHPSFAEWTRFIADTSGAGERHRDHQGSLERILLILQSQLLRCFFKLVIIISLSINREYKYRVGLVRAPDVLSNTPFGASMGLERSVLTFVGTSERESAKTATIFVVFRKNIQFRREIKSKS